MAIVTSEMALVADVFRSYIFWTDGYSESFAEYFDRAAHFMSYDDRRKFLNGIGQLEIALDAYNENDPIWKSMGMNMMFKKQYEFSLSRMRAILNLY